MIIRVILIVYYKQLECLELPQKNIIMTSDKKLKIKFFSNNF